MSSFFVETVSDEEFEVIFKKLCTMVVFFEKKRLSVASVFVFLLDNQDFVDYLVEEANMRSRIDAFRRIAKVHPNITKSKIVINRALTSEAERKKKNASYQENYDDDISDTGDSEADL